jgi:short-subunit dehydrogenase
MVPLRNCGGAWSAVVRSYEVTFADKYGPWAVLAGASEGVGAAFAEAVAERGVNVVLLARRQTLLDEVATGIRSRTGVQTRTLAVDLAEPTATAAIVDITSDLEVGFFVYFAGSDPNFEPFLANPIETAETLVERNCVTPMRLCHHFAPAMVAKGSGGIVIFGSGAGFAGGPNMVAYSASKAFDMVFAEALWAELHGKGVDVLGLILGKTNTPELRRLEYSRGTIASLDEIPPGACAVQDVVSEAFDNLTNGPTWVVGEDMRAAVAMMGSITRNQAVQFIAEASAAAMGSDSRRVDG